MIGQSGYFGRCSVSSFDTIEEDLVGLASARISLEIEDIGNSHCSCSAATLI